MTPYQNAILKAEVLISHYARHKDDCSMNNIVGLGLEPRFCNCGYLHHFEAYRVAIKLSETVVHAPECPAACDDDAPEHELQCTCGGRDE